jgi:hypothetical protein
MITITMILSILAIILVLFILFKIYEAARPAIAKFIPEPWGNVIYWVLVLIVVVWALKYFGIVQPIIR